MNADIEICDRGHVSIKGTRCAVCRDLARLESQMQHRLRDTCTWPNESYDFHLSHPNLWKPLPVELT